MTNSAARCQLKASVDAGLCQNNGSGLITRSARPTPMLARLSVSIAVAIVATVGCVQREAHPLRLPPPNEISELIASGPGLRANSHMTDPIAIRRIHDLLLKNNVGYRVPFDTFPGPEYTVNFRDSNGDVLVIWLGHDWLGGAELRPRQGDNRIRRGSQEERTMLLALLGVSSP
jgi:hypothetical protein